MVIIRKEVGETPLEALERYRAGRSDLVGVPMTYAGRLDPMACGELMILIGDECKDKARYLGLDKEYEVEIVLGITTDTHDALGLAAVAMPSALLLQNDYNRSHFIKLLEKYVGRFEQEYPKYSSKMFSWKGDEPPTKDVEIYSIDLLESGKINSAELKTRIFSMIGKVKGDFRQEEIKRKWEEVLVKSKDEFLIQKIRVKCSSGTYMRLLADRVGGFALSINRTAIL